MPELHPRTLSFRPGRPARSQRKFAASNGSTTGPCRPAPPSVYRPSFLTTQPLRARSNGHDNANNKMGPIAERDLAGNKLPDGCNWRLCGGAQFEDNQDHVYTWEPGTEVPIEVFSLNVCRCSRLVARRRLSSEPPDPLPPRLISGTAVSQSERPRLNCRLSERADHQSHFLLQRLGRRHGNQYSHRLGAQGVDRRVRPLPAGLTSERNESRCALLTNPLSRHRLAASTSSSTMLILARPRRRLTRYPSTSRSPHSVISAARCDPSLSPLSLRVG
jgi:hypothetical protein